MTKDELERIRKKYNGSHFTSLWSDYSATAEAEKHAGGILIRARERCFEEDVRGGETEEALSFLETTGHDQAARKFRAALDLVDPYCRHYAAGLALRGITHPEEG